MSELDSDRWEEVINSIRGSCVWCKSAIYVCHLCELIVLSEGIEALRFGVQQDSSYQKPSASSSRKPTVFVDRRLLVEHTNPARGLPSKAAALGCVLAHEMAHHVIHQSWDIHENYRDVVAMPVSQRRNLLRMVAAEQYARLAGNPSSIIDDHWAQSGNSLRNRSDAHQDFTARSEDSAAAEVRMEARVLGEWGAAVVGCMFAVRLSAGRSEVERLRENIRAAHPVCASSAILWKIISAACLVEDAEARARDRAVDDLTDSHRNPDIQSCKRRLEKAGIDWSSVSLQPRVPGGS